MDFDFHNTWTEPDSFRAQSVVGSFTLNDVKLQKHFKGSLPIEDDDWQIGIIVGRSGSGKSSIAKKLFPNEYITSFEYQGKCILDDFPTELSTSEITRMLCSVGFASPPDWLRLIVVLARARRCELTWLVHSACLRNALFSTNLPVSSIGKLPKSDPTQSAKPSEPNQGNSSSL